MHQKKQKSRCGPACEGKQGDDKKQGEKAGIKGKREDSDVKYQCGEAGCREKQERKEAGEDGPNAYELLWGSMQVGDIVDKVGRGHHGSKTHLGRVGNRDKSRDLYETAKKCRMEGK